MDPQSKEVADRRRTTGEAKESPNTAAKRSAVAAASSSWVRPPSGVIDGEREHGTEGRRASGIGMMPAVAVWAEPADGGSGWQADADRGGPGETTRRARPRRVR